jgi:hypothetical protein
MLSFERLAQKAKLYEGNICPEVASVDLTAGTTDMICKCLYSALEYSMTRVMLCTVTLVTQLYCNVQQPL